MQACKIQKPACTVFVTLLIPMFFSHTCILILLYLLTVKISEDYLYYSFFLFLLLFLILVLPND